MRLDDFNVSSIKTADHPSLVVRHCDKFDKSLIILDKLRYTKKPLKGCILLFDERESVHFQKRTLVLSRGEDVLSFAIRRMINKTV